MAARLPYPGLRAFTRNESDLFFGRDGCVDQMVARLAETKFLAVLGTSGTGKSSLVNTGLLDALELGLHPAGSRWRIRTLTPGGAPFTALATALLDGPLFDDDARFVLEGFLRLGPASLPEWASDGHLQPNEHLLILVDQFEELFRLDSYEGREDAEAFCKLLIRSADDASSRVHVVITMRSEFLGVCALVPGLAERINNGLYLVPRMTRSECYTAIVGPAAVVGLTIESALTNRILNDMESFAPWESDAQHDPLNRTARRADQLPVMQHVLNRMAQCLAVSGESLLTLAEYERLGGFRGALDAHGGEVLDALGPARLPLVERTFRALVAGNSPDTATRRSLSLRDLLSATGGAREDVTTVLDVFRAPACNFLRPSAAATLTDSTVIDIGHESLIRQWSALSGWVNQEARAATSWRRLVSAAEHERDGEGELLSGLDLSNLLGWWHAEHPTPGWAARYGGNFPVVHEFLRRSEHTEARRRQEEAERDNREKRRLTEALDIAQHNLVVAIGATESLALQVARNLETNRDIDSAAKLVVIDDIERRFEQVSQSLASSPELLVRKCELLLTNARMFSEVGHTAHAIARAERAHALLFPPAGEAPRVSTHLRAQAKLALAEARLRQMQIAEAQREIEAAVALLTSMPVVAWETAITAARVAGVMAELYSFGDRLHDALVVAEHGFAAATRFLADAPPKAHASIEQTLNEARVELLFQKSYALGRIRFDRMPALESARSLLAECFSSAVDVPGSYYLRAKLKAGLALQFADAFSDRNEYRAAASHLDEAIEELDRLCVRDWQNLECRRDLARALVHRASVASSQRNYRQARLDVLAARTLAYLIRLDDANPVAALSLSVWADYRAATIDESEGKPTAVRVAQQMSARLHHYSSVVDPSMLLRVYGAYEAWVSLASTDMTDEQRKKVIGIAERRFDLFAHEPSAIEDRIYAALQRYFALSRLFRFSFSAIGADRWQRYFDAVIADATFLADTMPARDAWVYDTCIHTARRATLLRDDAKDDEAALAGYEEAVRLVAPLLHQTTPYESAARGATYFIEELTTTESAIRRPEQVLRVVNQCVDALEAARAEAQPKRPFEEAMTRLRDVVGRYVTRCQASGNGHADVLQALVSRVERSTASSEEGGPPRHVAGREAEAVPAPESVDYKDVRLGNASLLRQLKAGEGSRISWEASPLYVAGWRTLIDQERSDALDQFIAAGAFERDTSDRAQIRIRTTPVDFYDDGRLLEAEVETPMWPRMHSLLIVRDGAKYLLNGTSPPIHQANATGVLRLDTATQVAGYLRFFCSYVNGEDGSFQLVEHVNELLWDSTADKTIRQKVSRLLRSVVVWKNATSGEDPKGTWEATGTVNYDDALFFAKFRIQPTGKMEMLEDEPLVEGLPVTPRRVSADGRANEALKRVAVLQQREAVTFGDDLAFLEHLAKIPAPARPSHFDRLVREATEMSTFDPTDGTRLSNTSFTLLQADLMIDRALELAEQAHTIAPEGAHALHTLAYAYTKKGRYEEAVPLFEQATREPKVAAEAFVHMAQAYRLMGLETEARDALGQARMHDPSAETAAVISAEVAKLTTA